MLIAEFSSRGLLNSSNVQKSDIRIRSAQLCSSLILAEVAQPPNTSADGSSLAS